MLEPHDIVRVLQPQLGRVCVEQSLQLMDFIRNSEHIRHSTITFRACVLNEIGGLQLNLRPSLIRFATSYTLSPRASRCMYACMDVCMYACMNA